MSKSLFLNKELYCRVKIERAIFAYKELSQIEISDSGQHWVCDFRDCIYGERLTMQEFENYLIGVLNCMGNQDDFM